MTNAPLTMQEAFNIVCKHAATMACRSAQGGTYRCVYRASNGNRCFIGALIPDADYKREMEFKDAATIAPTIAKLRLLDSAFVDQLQGCHDDPGNWSALGFIGWSELRDLAVRYGLDPSAAVRHL